jgi:adenylate cyclase class IV
MKQELKIRIDDYPQIEKKLLALGATFIKETYFTDTYFNTPQGTVLKIVENDEGASLVKFAENKGKFDVVSRETIVNLVEKLKNLTFEHGINKILKGNRKEYIYKSFELTFNIIEHLGKFLIITSEDSQDEFIRNELNIKIPDYITVPFNEL